MRLSQQVGAMALPFTPTRWPALQSIKPVLRFASHPHTPWQPAQATLTARTDIIAKGYSSSQGRPGNRAMARTPKQRWLPRHPPREFSPSPRTPCDYKRVPVDGHNGHWCGKRGDSLWASTHPKVLHVTQGEGIPFVAGYPDFQPWAVATERFALGVLQGTSGDAGRADGQWACRMGCDVGTAKRLRKQRGLVWHHVEDCQTLHLLPALLHANIPHAGGAVLLRHARRATTSPCLQP